MLIKLILISLLMIVANIIFIKSRWAACNSFEQMIYKKAGTYPKSILFAGFWIPIWSIVALVSTIILIVTW